MAKKSVIRIHGMPFKRNKNAGNYEVSYYHLLLLSLALPQSSRMSLKQKIKIFIQPVRSVLFNILPIKSVDIVLQEEI